MALLDEILSMKPATMQGDEYAIAVDTQYGKAYLAGGPYRYTSFRERALIFSSRQQAERIARKYCPLPWRIE